MKLSDLLKYDSIVIQCHDEPDADAFASGYAVYRWLTSHGKRARFVYSGSTGELVTRSGGATVTTGTVVGAGVFCV